MWAQGNSNGVNCGQRGQLGLSEFKWAYVGLCGLMWVYVDLCGLMWAYVGRECKVTAIYS